MKKANLIETVAYIHIQDNKILLVKSHGKDAFYMPGGKREPGEDDTAALIREVKEELTVDLHPASIKHFGEFQAQAYGKPDGVTVQISCYFGEHQGTLKANAEIEEIAFFSYDEYFAQENTAPAVKLILAALTN
jgi:8-oxo-dGTP diphosphatase